MEYGIMHHRIGKELFEWINNRPLCWDCWEERSLFEEKDKIDRDKRRKHNCRSNMFPGFSSETVDIPIDVLIVADAHGGGREGDFRKQEGLDEEVVNLGDYYLIKEIERYHQYETRQFLHQLNQKKLMWVFADLIKCYVWQKRDKNINGRKNRETAIKHCRAYLDEQIKIFKPKKIIVLGKSVARDYFGLLKPFHGQDYPANKWVAGSRLVYSIFPSRNTANLWVANKQWGPILAKV